MRGAAILYFGIGLVSALIGGAICDSVGAPAWVGYAQAPFTGSLGAFLSGLAIDAILKRRS